MDSKCFRSWLTFGPMYFWSKLFLLIMALHHWIAIWGLFRKQIFCLQPYLRAWHNACSRRGNARFFFFFDCANEQFSMEGLESHVLFNRKHQKENLREWRKKKKMTVSSVIVSCTLQGKMEAFALGNGLNNQYIAHCIRKTATNPTSGLTEFQDPLTSILALYFYSRASFNITEALLEMWILRTTDMLNQIHTGDMKSWRGSELHQ